MASVNIEYITSNSKRCRKKIYKSQFCIPIINGFPTPPVPKHISLSCSSRSSHWPRSPPRGSTAEFQGGHDDRMRVFQFVLNASFSIFYVSSKHLHRIWFVFKYSINIINASIASDKSFLVLNWGPRWVEVCTMGLRDTKGCDPLLFSFPSFTRQLFSSDTGFVQSKIPILSSLDQIIDQST